MPRRIFSAGTVTNTTGAPLRLTFYANSTTPRREADLWTVDGSNNLSVQIPNGVILTDASGAYSAFAGPDDVDKLYLNAHTGSSRTAVAATGYVSSSVVDAGLTTTYVPRVFPSGITNLGVYNARSQVYNLTASHLRRFRAKAGLAAAGNGLCRIACVGDSITAGQSSTYATQSWPSVLRARLASQGLASSGTGWVSPTSGSSPADARWTYTGTWGAFIAQQSFLNKSTTSGATATFTSDQPGTIAELIYSNVSAGFTVAIDGGAPVTVTPTGAQTTPTYSVTGLANTTHTITVTTSSASSVYVGPARVRAAAGMDVSNLGIGASRASDWMTSQLYHSGSITLNNVVPDLTFLSFMTNEAQNSVSAATYQTELSRLVDAFTPTSDVVLIAAVPAQNYDLNALGYRSALYSVADAKNVPVIDFLDRWGSYTSANGFGLFTDTLHPNANGYADLGLAVSRPLLGAA